MDERIDRANSAIASWQAGRVEEAIASFRQLVAEDPNDGLCLFMLGAYLWDAGQSQEGATYLRRAVDLMPSHRLATEILFNALWDSGDQVAAHDALRRFLAIRRVDEIEKLADQVGKHLGETAG